jgi:spore maturation protein SpmA
VLKESTSASQISLLAIDAKTWGLILQTVIKLSLSSKMKTAVQVLAGVATASASKSQNAQISTKVENMLEMIEFLMRWLRKCRKKNQ